MRNDLIGTWTLARWYNRTSAGDDIYPLGPDATGYICYSPDGHVFVHLAANGRAPFAVNDPFAATMAEDSAAMKSHITYAGSYEVEGTDVLHHVSQSCCPNWVGTVQRRAVRFEDADTLILSAGGARFQGHDVTAFVHWTRATPFGMSS